jgi:aldose 1-epimerase
MMILKNEIIELHISPEKGGSMTAFQWRGRDVFRRGNEASTNPLEQSSFAMVPYSGRIGQGDLGTHTIPTNRPDVDPLHPLHGTGWVAAWDVVDDHTLAHSHDGTHWLGPFDAVQRFILHDNGFTHEVTITNTADAALPCGMGLHPYFPRTGAKVSLRLDAMWHNDDNRLPNRLEPIAPDHDWLGQDHIDNCFTGLTRDVTIQWPSHTLIMTPDPAFTYAVVYCPHGEDYFCVEPVSHVPDPMKQGGLKTLQPGEIWTTRVGFQVFETVD